MYRYTEDHDWIESDGAIATLGITNYAVTQLGDIVHVELPEPGRAFARGDAIATVESVKAASDIIAPLAGEIVEVNAALAGDPGLVNRDPMAEGWLFRLRLADQAEADALLSAEDYRTLLGPDAEDVP